MPAPVAAGFGGSANPNCDLLVLAGRYAKLGGVCLSVRCIPSNALLQVAAETTQGSCADVPPQRK